MKVNSIAKMLIVLVLFQFLQVMVLAATEVLGELTTSVSSDFQYGPGDGTFILDLSDFLALADSTETIEQKFVKIANDIAAEGGANTEMPEFQVTLERDYDYNGSSFSADEIYPFNLTTQSLGILNNFYNIQLDPNPADDGDFDAEKVYTVTITELTGGWAAQSHEDDPVTYPNPKERLRIGIKNNAAEERTYFGAKGDTAVEAEVPWIKIIKEPSDVEEPDEISFGQVILGSDQIHYPLEIANVGTGPLTISTVDDPTIGAFTWPGITTGMPFGPVGSIETTITFNPKHSSLDSIPLGPITPVNKLSFANNSHNDTNLEVKFPVELIKVELVMLFDRSGSMTFTAEGEETSNPAEMRMTRAKQAGMQLKDIFNGMEGDKVGVGLAAFPRPGAAPPSASALVPYEDYVHVSIGTLDDSDSALKEKLQDGANSLQAAPVGALGGTPLAEGLNLAHGIDDFNYGDNKWTVGEYVRRAILLFADGEHNVNSNSLYKTPEEWVTYLSTFGDDSWDKKIKIFTVAYGTAQYFDITILQNIAAASAGEFYNAVSTNIGSIKTAFRKALIESQDWTSIDDPGGNLKRGGPAKYHDVCIDDGIERVTFVVDWQKVSLNSIDFVLVGPDGIISKSHPDVYFKEDKTYALYTVKGQTAKGHKGSDKWTLKLTGSTGLNHGETVDYIYSVLGKSKVKLNTQSGWQNIYTLNDSLFAVKIDGLSKKQAKSANVTLKYDIPNQSHGTWLSTMANFKNYWLVPRIPRPDPGPVIETPHPTPGPQISTRNDTVPTHKQYAPETIMGEPASMVQRKAYALKNFAGNPFQNKRASGTIKLHDDGKNGDKLADDGIYSAYLPDLKYDGMSTFGVFLESGSDDDCLNRERWTDNYISVSLVSEILGNQLELENFEITPFFPLDLPFPPYPKEGMIRKNVVFTPKDSFGNYWGPGHANQVSFAVKNAEALGHVVDNMDGSYIQVIDYKRGETPIVSVTARGVTSPEIKMKPSPSVDFGIKGGLNFANLSAAGSTPVFDWNNKTGFCVGAFLTFNLSDYFALQPEAFFSRKGLKVDRVTTTSTYNIDFIEVPLLLKFTLSPGGTLSPNLFAGPFAAIKISDNITAGSAVPDIKTFDFGVAFGCGVDFNLGGLTFISEARYTMGLVNIADVPTTANITVKSKVLSFMIGLRF